MRRAVLRQGSLSGEQQTIKDTVSGGVASRLDDESLRAARYLARRLPAALLDGPPAKSPSGCPRVLEIAGTNTGRHVILARRWCGFLPSAVALDVAVRKERDLEVRSSGSMHSPGWNAPRCRSSTCTIPASLWLNATSVPTRGHRPRREQRRRRAHRLHPVSPRPPEWPLTWCHFFNDHVNFRSCPSYVRAPEAPRAGRYGRASVGVG
jgi:hypothetical protein